MGKAKGEDVPYRNSVLTRMLQNALGGNSKTIMVCAISPAFMNYEETLSTLRFAKNAKKIQNSANINESSFDKLIKELKADNMKLREMLISQKSGANTGLVDLEAPSMTNIGELIEEKINENEKIMVDLVDLQKPFWKRLAEAKARDGKTTAQALKSDEEEK